MDPSGRGSGRGHCRRGRHRRDEIVALAGAGRRVRPTGFVVIGGRHDNGADDRLDPGFTPDGGHRKHPVLFVADNGAGCIDILDTQASERGRTGLLGCTVSRGDVRVDLGLFDSAASLAAYFARTREAVGDGGRFKNWNLGGAGSPVTGSTLEFIAKGGRATILWTYNARGMYGFASRNDGDQAELNKWWASIGSFVEDSVAAEVIAGR